MDIHIPGGFAPPPIRRPAAGTPRKSGMRLVGEAGSIDIDELWETGFALSRTGPQPSRGHVDVYDGTRHLFCALIYKAGETTTSCIYRFKRSRPAGPVQPADYVRNPGSRISGLLTERRG